MFCSQCAHKLTPSDVYCPKCAKPIASFNFDPGHISQVEYIADEELTAVRPPPDRRSLLPWLAGSAVAVLGILLAAALGYIAFVKPTPVVINVPPASSPTPDQSAEIRRAEQSARNAQIALNKSLATPVPTKTPIDLDAERAKAETIPAANRAMVNAMRGNARTDAQRRGGCYSGPNGLSFDSPRGAVALGAYQPVTIMDSSATHYKIQYQDRSGVVPRNDVVCY